MKLIIYTDGASRGNPGPASFGFTISEKEGGLIHEDSKYIGIATNNTAEYKAVLEAFKWIKKNISKKVEISLYADSKLVAEQLSGKWKIKKPHLKILIDQIKILEFEIGKVYYTHVPREQNTRADKLANQALDSSTLPR